MRDNPLVVLADRSPIRPVQRIALENLAYASEKNSVHRRLQVISSAIIGARA